MLPKPTSRLTFREMTREDVPAIWSVFSDPLALRFYPAMHEIRAAQDWVEWNLANYAEHGFGLWALVSESGELVGDCGLTWQHADGEQVLEIGYHLAAAHRGKGYAMEAASAALDLAFRVTSEKLIGSIVSAHNQPSIAVAKRLHRLRKDYSNKRGEPRILFYTRREALHP